MNENLKALWIELTELQSDFIDLKNRFDLLTNENLKDQMQIFSELFKSLTNLKESLDEKK